MIFFIQPVLKVRISRKKNMLSWILPKNERWGNFMYWKMPQRSFFGRIQYAIICFCRECVSTGAAGAQTRRSLKHHLLIPPDFQAFSTMCTRCFETQSSPGYTCTRRSKILRHSLFWNLLTFSIQLLRLIRLKWA